MRETPIGVLAERQIAAYGMDRLYRDARIRDAMGTKLARLAGFGGQGLFRPSCRRTGRNQPDILERRTCGTTQVEGLLRTA
jgi:hypothetical protein